KDVGSVESHVVKVIDAAHRLEAEDALTLDELSASVGLSSFHLQRSFKEILGVSPKKYAETRRMEKLKEGLRTGSDVTTAMYDAGFGSSSRLYEKAAAHMGMTPAVYKKGGKDMTITFAITDCELG